MSSSNWENEVLLWILLGDGMGKQHHFPLKMSLLKLFDRILFLFRVGTNPPEPLNSPNLDGEPLSSYTGNYWRRLKWQREHTTFILTTFQNTIVILPTTGIPITRSRAEAAKSCGSEASPGCRHRSVNLFWFSNFSHAPDNVLTSALT